MKKWKSELYCRDDFVPDDHGRDLSGSRTNLIQGLNRWGFSCPLKINQNLWDQNTHLMTNSNNNNEDDGNGLPFYNRGSDARQTESDFIISDDDDDDRDFSAVEHYLQELDRTALSREDEDRYRDNMNNTTLETEGNFSNEFRKSSDFKKCGGIFKHSIKDLPTFIWWTINLILTKLILLTIYLIYAGLRSTYRGLQNFTGKISILDICLALPKVFIKWLYYYCSLNECRRMNTGSFFNFRGKRRTNEDDIVITKCSWPLWAVAIMLLLVFIFGCHFSNPHATIKDKYRIGTDTLKEFVDILLFNFYNLPGYDCMTNDNCCTSRRTTIKRWIYCFVSLPYRVSLNGISSSIIKLGSLEENLQNITDWRLKRKIRRLKALMDEMNLKVLINRRKVYQAEKQFHQLKAVAVKNLTRVSLLVAEEEELDNQNEENIKKFEDLNGKITILNDIKASLDKTLLHVKKCMKCSSKKIITEAEKITSTQNNLIYELGEKVKILEGNLQEKLKWVSVNIAFDKAKKELLSLQNCNTKWLTKLSQYESYTLKFQSDVDNLRNYILDRFNNEMNRFSQKNRDLVDKMEKGFSNNQQKIDELISIQKVSAAHLIRDSFNVQYKNIKNNIIEEYCPKVREFVRMTVVSTLTMSNHIKSCGMANRVKYSHENCLKNAFKEIDNNCQDLSCCRTESGVLLRIKEVLTLLSADKIGLVDFGCISNGGQILEYYTSPSLYYSEIETKNDINHLSTGIWNQLFSSTKQLKNSVNILNSGQVQPGKCWQFKGHKGHTIFKLATVILITSVTLDHIHPSLSLTKDSDDAPKSFNIYALRNEKDPNEILVGSFVFEDPIHNSVQQFMIKERTQTQFIKFEILTNHGANNTCVYRLRIHGDPLKRGRENVN